MLTKKDKHPCEPKKTKLSENVQFKPSTVISLAGQAGSLFCPILLDEEVVLVDEDEVYATPPEVNM